MDFYSLRCMFVIMVVTFTSAIPPDYCLKPANLSDCGMKPTAIFSYYLPGSRCELEIWRGCPTLNRFSDQYECIDHCIYHYKRFGIAQDEAYHIKFDEHAQDYGNNDVGVGPTKPSIQESTSSLPTRCRVDLNTNMCSSQASGKTVFTYNTETGECEETSWYHCSPAENQFESEWKCENICLSTQTDWKDQLTQLVDAEDLDSAIEDFIQNIDYGDESNGDKGYNNQTDANDGNKGSGNGQKGGGNSDKDDHEVSNNNDGIKGHEGHKNDNDIHNGNNSNHIDNGHNNTSSNGHEGSNDTNFGTIKNHTDNDGSPDGNKDNHNSHKGSTSHTSNNDNYDKDKYIGPKVPDKNNNSNQNGAVDNENRDVDNKETNDDEESGPNDSGEPNYTQVNFATTEVQKFKKIKKHSLIGRSKRLMAFFNDNKDDYII